jgi:hypothetical protein|tara:strand:- start:415 stop:642 length:228 start_codon:yes stop_codon:yes gene_type:complete
MDSVIVIGIGILLLILIFFIFTQIHLKEINVKTQQNMNGISHVWGVLMELKLDLQMLEDKLSVPNLNEVDEVMEE